MSKPTITLQTDELDSLNVELKRINSDDEPVKPAHRDDHYMFIVLEEGSFNGEIDFLKITFSEAHICFIIPGQVHRFVEREGEGWLLFVATDLIPKKYREIFDTYLQFNQFFPIDQNNGIFNLLPILDDLIKQDHKTFKYELTKSLIEATTGMMISSLLENKNTVHAIGSRKYETVAHFKKMVQGKYKTIRLVKDYASLLHITPLYLNEVVKEITGFPASFWIQQEILLEAKRLLYYTNMDVKEIAYELGYEDPTYFARFFKKNENMTASEFRIKNHDMSTYNP